MSNDMVSRIRRNHALEHATINVLSQKHKNFSAQGNSTHRGFNLNIYGQIGEEDVVNAVDEAYRRLQKGEEKLALHPNCGTVLLTTATLAVLAVQATFSLEQRRQRRSRMAGRMTLPVLIGALPAAILAASITMVAARPLGMMLQANYTVDGDLGELEVTAIRQISPSLVTRLFQLLLGQANNEDVHAYRIETAG